MKTVRHLSPIAARWSSFRTPGRGTPGRGRSAVGSLVVLVAISVTGCGGTTDTVADSVALGDPPASVDAKPASYASQSPQELLAATFERYRAASSYRDNGRVTMTYRVGDSEMTRVAPMRLWLDRNELYLETYDVRLTSDADGLTAWVADPLSNHFDSQVLKSKPLPGRPTAEGLIADPILVGRVAAGLAGPPPQLEWLFSDFPMKTMFQEPHRFQYGPTRIVDGRHCPSVVVEADTQRFEFWIDPPTSTIRRVQLPSIVAPLTPGAQPQPIALTIDLVGATFKAPDRAPQIERLPQPPKLVSRFVPLPPPRPARILGTQVRPIRASSVDGGLNLSHRGVDRPLTALVRLTADQSTTGAVAAAQWWANQMADEVAKKIRIAVLVDADVPDSVAGQSSLPVFVDTRGDIARTLEMDPGAILLIDDQGFVVWVEPNFSIATLPTLGGVVSDLQSGVNVPERLRKQWSEQVAMYDRECAKAAIRGN